MQFGPKNSLNQKVDSFSNGTLLKMTLTDQKIKNNIDFRIKT